MFYNDHNTPWNRSNNPIAETSSRGANLDKAIDATRVRRHSAPARELRWGYYAGKGSPAPSSFNIPGNLTQSAQVPDNSRLNTN